MIGYVAGIERSTLNNDFIVGCEVGDFSTVYSIERTLEAVGSTAPCKRIIATPGDHHVVAAITSGMKICHGAGAIEVLDAVIQRRQYGIGSGIDNSVNTIRAFGPHTASRICLNLITEAIYFEVFEVNRCKRRTFTGFS